MSKDKDVSCPSGFSRDGEIKEVKMEMGRTRVRFSEERREWRSPGLFFADVMVL